MLSFILKLVLDSAFLFFLPKNHDLSLLGYVVFFRAVQSVGNRGMLAYFEFFLTSSYAAMILRSSSFYVRMAIVSFILQRLYLLYHKSLYTLTFILTTSTNVKQRFSSQTLISALYLTLFLPFYLLTLLITTLLDVPTIPYLGFPIFITSFLRPHK